MTRAFPHGDSLCRGWIDHGWGSNDDTRRWGGHLVLEHLESRMGWDFHWNAYTESGPDASWSDSLHLGDSNFLIRAWQSPELLVRAGVGMNFYLDSVGSEYGLNFTS